MDLRVSSIALLKLSLTLLALAFAPDVLSQEDAATATVSVSISGVEDELLTNVQGFLPLFRFNDKEAPTEGRLKFLHGQAQEAVARALAPFGYYRPTLDASLELTDGVWQANYVVDPADRIPLVSVDIKVSGEAESDPEYIDAIKAADLKTGTPLIDKSYQDLKQRFQVLASERGYFDGQLTESRIGIDLKAYEANIVLHFDSGMRYFLGDVTFEQDIPWINPEMLGRYSDIVPGQPYSARDVQSLQNSLSGTQYYSQITLDVSPENADENRVIPVKVELTHRNPTRYSFGAGFGTDTGARVKAGFIKRRVNRWGHHFNGEVLLAELKFGIAGEYTIPGKDPRTDAYGLRASVEDENSSTSNFTSTSLGGFYRHRVGLWTRTYALDFLLESFEENNEDTTSRLLIPSVDWTRTFPPGVEDRIYPTFGTLLTLSVKGAAEGLLSDTSFIQPLISGKVIYSFANSHRLIARGAAGVTFVQDFDLLPTSIRFFTGGDTTVRGFGFDRIGPVEDGDVVGGEKLLESSLTYEVPFAEKWSVVGFVDSGDAFNDSPDFKTGVGFGIHWRSPIGPVRVDIGHALDRPPGSRLRLHLTIGSDL